MRAAAAVLLAAILSGACGGRAVTPAEDVVAAAQESLQERDAGRLDLALEASAEGSETVGFGVEGDYEFGDGDLAVVDIAYVLDAGEESATTRIVSDGDAAVVVVGDEVVAVPEAQSRSLRVGERAAPAVPELDLTAWVKDGEVRTVAKGTEVRGELRAAAFVSDLQRIAAGVAGGAAGAMSRADAERLEQSVTASEIVLQTEGDDHELRSLRATVEFGARVPAELRKALGRYAGARLSLTFEIDDIRTPLRVELPS